MRSLVVCVWLLPSAASLRVAATRRQYLAGLCSYSSLTIVPQPAFASAAGASAAKARADAKAAEVASPINRLNGAKQDLEGASQTLPTLQWGETREQVQRAVSQVRAAVAPTADPELRALRSEFLAGATAVDEFAYAQQQRNWRDKYPQGYAQFLARNDGLDLSQPSDSLQQAQRALDGLITAALR
jgi:hypothetical protein